MEVGTEFHVAGGL